MGSRQESSVIFSLQNLLELERERVEKEAERQRQRAEQERVARERALRAAREEQERIAREQAARQDAERHRRLEEEARIEAIRQAELERARLEAAHRERLAAELLQREQAHQIALVESTRKQTRNARFVLAATALALVLFVIGVVRYLQANASQASELEVQRAELAREYSGVIDQFRERMKRTNDDLDATRRRLDQVMNAKREDSTVPGTRTSEPLRKQTPRPRRPVERRKGPDCDPHDPMCGF